MAKNGLFTYPLTSQDLIVLAMAVLGTFFRLYLIYRSDEIKRNPKGRDWIGVVLTSMILTIGLYEIALSNHWKLQLFYLPFAFVIVIAKDITDWLFLDADGKRFILNTFKIFFETVLARFGYTKNNKDE